MAIYLEKRKNVNNIYNRFLAYKNNYKYNAVSQSTKLVIKSQINKTTNETYF